MKKKNVHFITILSIMLSFSMPISAMYFQVLQRFSDDITTKRRDIKKISDQLIQTYSKYIGTVRKQKKNPELFGDLEIILATELSRREQPKPPLKSPPLPTLTVTVLAKILDGEYSKLLSSEKIFFTGKRQSELTSLLKTIEEYRVKTKEAQIYDELFNAIQKNLGVEKLEEKLKDLTIPFLNAKNVNELESYIQKIDNYRDLTGNLQNFHNIYDYALQRIVILRQPKEPPKPPEMGGWLTQNNTGGLFLGQKDNVLQVRVYSQGKKDGGGPASCGYHSLKNSILIMRTILKKESIELINDYQFIARYIGQPTYPGVWRKMIIEKNYTEAGEWYFDKYSKSAKDDQQALKNYNEYTQIRGYQPLDVKGEWLKEDDIRQLIKFEKEKGQLKDLGIEYTVMENIKMMRNVKLREFSEYRTVHEIAQKIKANNNYLHGFSVGLMGHHLVGRHGQKHWISLVVNKVDGKVQFIVADSLNANRYDLTQNLVVRILIKELSR